MSAPTSLVPAALARELHQANGSFQTSDCQSDCHDTSVNYLFILLCVTVMSSLPTVSFGQDGHHGVGHETWHGSFYSTLIRKDTKTSCCNLSDCRPTESRM